ncbi:TPA: hypothetical protein ACGIZG_001595 [Corynebacterium striatum]|nr:hypothetical protein [Corynebacterium striatum]HAT6563677.1 hypothetical protein [Corynebacterium striatum]HAT6569029.1 hypothetical protein [Corynebacterium striatum]HAT6625300.1 hypothetical protein [Corynebacterium striatum]HCG2976163.1 hypothetical protein [Corynebacterium striatum]
MLTTTTQLTMTASQTEKHGDNHRTISGLILPFGEVGNTSAGPLTFSADSIRIPENPRHLKLYRDHSNAGGTPVGYATSIEVKDDGIHASFQIANTAHGDLAFTDVTEGIRDALSVEVLSESVAGGHVTDGILAAVALVPVPAFASARVDLVTASDATDSPDQDDPTKASAAPSPTTDPETEETMTNMPAAAPSGIKATPRGDSAPVTASAVYDAMQRIATGAPVEGRLTAALKALQTANSTLGMAPEWLGHLWEGQPYQRQFVPAMTAKNLSGLKLKGYVWAEKPGVAPYDGHPAEVPSQPAKYKLVEATATRLAGANSMPREFIDFNLTEEIADYFNAMAESYAIQSDEKALADALAAATAVKGTGDHLLKAVGRARKTIRKNTRGIEPSIYVVNDEDHFNLLDVVNDDVPAYLELIGATPEKLVPTDKVAAGHVVAWAKPAIIHGELAGSPIRANALDIAHGGIDQGVYGYRATIVAKPDAIVDVTFTAATPRSER